MRGLAKILICITMINVSACTVRPNTKTNGEGKDPVEANLPQSDKELSEKYLVKCQEIMGLYGKPDLISAEGSTNEITGCSYINGLCIVDILDFNGDGIEDLLLVYNNSKHFDENIYGQLIPSESTYEIEVWTLYDETLEQLLHIPFVGRINSSNTLSQSSVNCFITVFENTKGLPVVQLYSEVPYLRTYSYSNYYYSDQRLIEEQLEYHDQSMSITDVDMKDDSYIPVTEDAWDEHNSSYNKILLSAVLSNDGFTYTGLMKVLGIDIRQTIEQTSKVLGALENQGLDSFVTVEEDYLSSFVRQLDKANRERFTGNEHAKPAITYCLYDIDRNGVPELLIKSGEAEADYWYDIFAFGNGQTHRVENGFYGGHSVLYANGESGLLVYEASMGTYIVTQYSFSDNSLAAQELARGNIGWDQDYPSLDDLGMPGYQRLSNYYVPISVLLYNFSLA
ncbi:MAG: hypothetical protein FWH40_02255 [Coriobacteriia bacterium]|nr:hypothetical protein [Coriobacteriia bacterium]